MSKFFLLKTGNMLPHLVYATQQTGCTVDSVHRRFMAMLGPSDSMYSQQGRRTNYTCKRGEDLSNQRGKMRFHIPYRCLTSLGYSPITNTLSHYSWVKRSWWKCWLIFTTVETWAVKFWSCTTQCMSLNW